MKAMADCKRSTYLQFCATHSYAKDCYIYTVHFDVKIKNICQIENFGSDSDCLNSCSSTVSNLFFEFKNHLKLLNGNN